MACTCAPSLLHLRRQLDRFFPERDRRSDGCCASSKHTTQNPNSDHEPSDNGYAHAFDFDENIAPDLGPAPLMPWVSKLVADARCKYVIYEARLWYPDGTSKPYKGKNPHDSHLHLSIKRTATFATWDWPMFWDPLPKEVQAKPGPYYVEDDMTPVPIKVVLDSNGNGYSDDSRFEKGRLVSVMFNSHNPTERGYGKVPKTSALQVGQMCRMVFEGGAPNQRYDATAFVLGEVA